MTHLKINPAVLASEWSYPEIFEAFYFLRLQYLIEAPGGA
jgi:hypothetical protein